MYLSRGPFRGSFGGGLGELGGALLSSLGRLPGDSVLTPPRAPFTSPQGSRDPPDLGILGSWGSRDLGDLGILEIWGSGKLGILGIWDPGDSGDLGSWAMVGSTNPGLG